MHLFAALYTCSIVAVSMWPAASVYALRAVLFASCDRHANTQTEWRRCASVTSAMFIMRAGTHS